MPRPEKVQAVADIKERIENAQAVFLAEYAGLSVAHQQKLRRELKAHGAEFKVVKMTLARLAAAELEIDSLDEYLLGPTGIAIADSDAVAAAKVLKDFAGDHDVFKVKAGLLGLDYLSPERISELAEIEPREVLLAKMAGLFAAPMSSVAGLVSALQRDVVGLVQALVDKREASGEVAETTPEAEEAEDSADGSGDDAPVEEASAGEAASEEPEAPEEAAENAAASDDDAEPEAAADDAATDEAPSDEGDEEDTVPSEEASSGEDDAVSEGEGDDDKAEEE